MQSYDMPPETDLKNARKPVVAVIGSGFGGLAAAVRLLARGYQVKVFEQLPTLGGRARVHRQQGFTFDAGPTVITAPFMLEELWRLCGKNLADDVNLVPVDPFYRIRFDDGGWFNYTGDAAAMRAEVQRLCPGDVEGYEKFVAASRAIYEVGFEKLAHVPFDSIGSMLRIVPQMLKLKSFRTVHGLVSQYVRDDRLRQVLSFHPLLVGGNPFSTTSIYTLILYLERQWGVHFPIGGTGVLVQGLVNLIRQQGGEVHAGTPVRRLVIDKGRVKSVVLHGGEVVPCAHVVANSDVAWTYRNLIAPSDRPRWSDARLARRKYSMSLFVWYFGTRRRYPDVAHHSILLGPRYKALLEDIFKHHRLADDFSLYLHRPTATDPSLAPPGCDSFYVLSPVPHLQSGTRWADVGETYRAKISAHLERTVLPDLEANIVTSRLLTPQHFHDELLSYRGAAFGMEPVLQQSAYFRPHNKSEDIEGLYFVGAGTHPGAGLPGVLSSARVLDSVMPDA